jgi:hypothetical protein
METFLSAIYKNFSIKSALEDRSSAGARRMDRNHGDNGAARDVATKTPWFWLPALFHAFRSCKRSFPDGAPIKVGSEVK